MKAPVKAGAMGLVAMLVVGLGPAAVPASAAPVRVAAVTVAAAQPSRVVAAATTAKVASTATINAAIKAAAKGKTSALAKLLKSKSAKKTRTLLRAWMVKHGDFAWVKKLKAKKSTSMLSVQVPLATPRVAPSYSPNPDDACTGYYECTCTWYNGTMGWRDRPIGACHGWFDLYINGKHVAHIAPDLLEANPPRTISVECAKAGGVMILTVIAGVADLPTGPVGWAATGALAAIAVGDLVTCKK